MKVMRIIWAIAKKSFSHGTRLKTNMSKLTVIACVAFILVFIFLLSSFAIDYYTRDKDLAEVAATREYYIIGNAPDSLMRYMYDGLPELPFENRPFFEEVPAYYDFLTINSLLSEHSAYAAMVFPTDFDDVVFGSDKTIRPQVMTYFDTGNAYYKEMHDLFTESFLDGYSRFLTKENGATSTDSEPYQIVANDTSLIRLQVDDPLHVLVSRMIIPLFLFITILFAAMESGVSVIAGEKEKGTFAAILLTPVSRTQIVLGNALGVFFHTLIPCAILIPILVLGFGFNISTLPAVILVTVSLALLLTALVLVISILNKSILSAQTSFLPIFLVLLAVCVIAMQESGTPSPIYYYLPFYGHYNGITAALLQNYSPRYFVSLMAISLLITAILLWISAFLLRLERFTSAIDTSSYIREKRALAFAKNPKKNYIAHPKSAIFGYRPIRRRSTRWLIMYHFSLPVILISLFQPIALLFPMILYLRTESSNDWIESIAAMVNRMQINNIASSVMDLFNKLMQNLFFILAMGISYLLIIAVYIYIVKGFEKNPLSSIGMPLGSSRKRRDALLSYGRGLLIGVSMISCVYLLLIATGQIQPAGVAMNVSSVPLFLMYIFMWIPQGASEEIMLRGYMLPRIGAKFGRGMAVGLTSLLFGLLHAGNIGFSPLALVNLILIAVFFALLSIHTGEIFTVCAAHTAWNFAQGNLFGLYVSGADGAARIIHTKYSADSIHWLTGGQFGPEGGVAVTIIVIISLMLLLLKSNMRKRKRRAK